MSLEDTGRWKKAIASNTGAATDVSVVAAVTGKRIKVRRVVFTSSTAATLTLESGSSTAIFGPALNLTLLDLSGLKAMETASGSPLRYTTSTGNSNIYVEYQDE